MDKLTRHDGGNPEQADAAASNVFPLAIAARGRRELPPTDAEILEYRQLRPRLLRMLDEWEKVRGTCRLAREIVGGSR